MITEEQIDLVIERLIDRIEKANAEILKTFGKTISEIRKNKIADILKYDANYEKMLKELEKYTKLNAKDIDVIFREYTKQDQLFYEKFYKYRNIPFIQYAENEVLQRQTGIFANIVKNTMYNFTRGNILGYSLKDINGNTMFYGLRETYNRIVDNAILSISQGDETFETEMDNIIKQIGESGLKTIDYASGRSVRLDSAVRMYVKDGLKNLHNANQQILGEEFGYDGWEISVHSNPAPDHEDAQGHQFTIAEYDLLQTTGTAKDVNGKLIDMHRTLKSGEITSDFRPISMLNCYHIAFAIIVGVTPPRYNNDRLEAIKKANNEGFDYEGKHYTRYEGTQLQRKIETEIRKQKDIQILGVYSGEEKVVQEAQNKISVLTRKYKEISDASTLPTKLERLKVVGFRKVKF